VAIFHRQLKTPTEIDVDKDLDESLTESDLSDEKIPIFGEVVTKLIKTRAAPGQTNVSIESVVYHDDSKDIGIQANMNGPPKQKSASTVAVSCGVGNDDLDPPPVPKLQTWVQTTQTERGSIDRRTTRSTGAGLMGEMLRSNKTSLMDDMMSFANHFSANTDDLDVDDIELDVANKNVPDSREKKKAKSVTSQYAGRVVSHYISSEAPMLPLQNIEHENLG
jgi:hypothetical protein